MTIHSENSQTNGNIATIKLITSNDQAQTWYSKHSHLTLIGLSIIGANTICVLVHCIMTRHTSWGLNYRTLKQKQQIISIDREETAYLEKIYRDKRQNEELQATQERQQWSTANMPAPTQAIVPNAANRSNIQAQRREARMVDQYQADQRAERPARAYKIHQQVDQELAMQAAQNIQQ